MEEKVNINDMPKVRKLTALKVLSIIFCVATFVLLLVTLLDALANKGDDLKVALVFYFTFIVIVFGVIGNCLAIIPSVIGLVYSIVNLKKEGAKKQLKIYIVLTVVPILIEAFFIIFCVIKL